MYVFVFTLQTVILCMEGEKMEPIFKYYSVANRIFFNNNENDFQIYILKVHMCKSFINTQLGVQHIKLDK